MPCLEMTSAPSARVAATLAGFWRLLGCEHERRQPDVAAARATSLRMVAELTHHPAGWALGRPV